MMPERLAIDGGTPVRERLLPYGRQVIDEEDIQAVTEVLRGDWLTTGPAVEAYENAFAEYVGARHAVAVNSGTAALHAAVFAAGIRAGDEVITSPLTFAATANAALYCGGSVRFADVQPDTGNIAAEEVEKHITSRTKALIAVDFSGQPADLDEIRASAERHGLAVIEDAAHALGAVYKGRRVGAWADLTTFSTHPVKHITSGEGGMVTTDNEALANKMRAFRTHGVSSDAHARAVRGDWHYDMTVLGYNYRIPDILCALGRSQLAKLDAWLLRRQAIAARYTEAFASLPEVKPLAMRPDRESAWHIYPIRVDFTRLHVDRARLFKALRAEGIGVNVHYIPVYWHSYYQNLGYLRGLCPLAERLYEQLLTLPLWAGMGDEDVEDVIAALRKVVKAYQRTVDSGSPILPSTPSTLFPFSSNALPCLVFRADASRVLGTGHVMRCLTLAQAWKAGGGEISFVSSCGRELRERILDAGASLITVPGQFSARYDLEVTLTALGDDSGGILVLDGYDFRGIYQRRIKEAGFPLVVLDDIVHARHYYADLVVNQNLGAENLVYPRESYTRLLLGTQYALLRAEFDRWRDQKPLVSRTARRILITLGGGGPQHATNLMIRALERLRHRDWEARLVAGPGCSLPGLRQLQRAAGAGTGRRLRIERHVSNMAKLMAWADLAVSGGGTTCWELAFMGLPNAIIVLADNQRRNAEMLHGAGVSELVGNAETVTPVALAARLDALLDDWPRRREMSAAGRRLVDGWGCEHVIAAIKELGPCRQASK